MTSFLQDLRYALRAFRRNLPTNAIIVLVLAVGIGSSTGIFSIAYRLLQPLPFPYPERLMLIAGAGKPANEDRLAYWSQGDAFSALARYEAGAASLRTSSTERISAAMVSAEFLDVLDVRPQIGRAFSAEDEDLGGNRVALLSDDLWRSRFGGSREVLGKRITLDTQPFTVIGVMPAGIRFPGRTDIWAVRQSGGSGLSELSTDLASNDLPHSLRGAMIGRLNEGVTRTEAHTVLTVLLDRQRSENTDPKVGIGTNVSLTPLRNVLVRDYEPTLIVLGVAVALLLLIACATAANILLARLAKRQGEMAVRLVLGAGRVRIIRHLLAESSLLALLAGCAGVLIAGGTVQTLRLLAAGTLPDLAHIQIDLPVLAFALTLSLVTALLCGLAMAVAVRDARLSEPLRGARGLTAAYAGSRLRKAIIVGQIALALILLTTGAVMVQSLDRLSGIEPGLDAEGAFTVEALLPKAKYSPPGAGREEMAVQAARATAVFADIENALSTIPGVSNTAVVSKLPLSGETGGWLWFQVSEGRDGMALYLASSGSYFRAMGIPLLAGRSFDERDTPTGQPVAIINQTFARTYWGDESPVGKSILLEPQREIIGVVGDVKFDGLGEEPSPQVYLPLGQFRQLPPLSMSVVFRGPSNPDAVLAELQRRIPPGHDVSFFRPRAITDVITDSVSPMRFRGVVLTAFAVAALLLAALAVYGAISNAVVSRTHEIGLRMAVGARRWDIVALFVGQAALLGSVGVAIGVGGALLMEQVISSLLFGIEALDPITFATAIPFLLGLLLLASSIPAWRASRLDPSRTLRHD